MVMRMAGGGWAAYSKKDGSFSFIAYIHKSYSYGISLKKYGYYDIGADIDTTKTAQNFTLKLARKAWYTDQKLPSKNNP